MGELKTTSQINSKKIATLIIMVIVTAITLLSFSVFATLSNIQLRSDQTLISSVFRVAEDAIVTRDEIKIQRILAAFHEEGNFFKVSLKNNFEIIWPREFFNPIWNKKPSYTTSFAIGESQKVNIEYWTKEESSQNLIKIFLSCISFFLLIGSIGTLYYLLKKYWQDLSKMDAILYGGSAESTEFNFGFFKNIALQILEKERARESQLLLQQQLIREKKITEVGMQLSHDIRSPLAALEMISSKLNELSDDKRVIIRNSINRIRDIANSLVIKSNRINEVKTSDSYLVTVLGSEVEMSLLLLLPLIDMTVTEKRIEYQNIGNIEITFQQTLSSYGLFTKFDPSSLKRVLSNLINNSIEAIGEKLGKIELSLCELNADWIEIKVLDSGRGMSAQILKKIGIRGNTFEKVGGSGLGFAHAKETIESSGGKLLINSSVGFGTTITILLPKHFPPSWFLPQISLDRHSKIVILDDDRSIQEIWRNRIDPEFKALNDIEIITFSDSLSFRKYYSRFYADLATSIIIMDYELFGSNETGLDIIEQLGIKSQSILVTSRWEEETIRSRCESLEVKLIPKSMSGFVPIVCSV